MTKKYKEPEVGVYVNITPELDQKLAFIARLLPQKTGKRWFKKDVIAKACELYVKGFFALLDEADGIDEMMAMAKEIDPNGIVPETTPREPAEQPADMPQEDTGLREP